MWVRLGVGVLFGLGNQPFGGSIPFYRERLGLERAIDQGRPHNPSLAQVTKLVHDMSCLGLSNICCGAC